MTPKTKWRIWIAATLGSFLALEVPAIVDGRRGNPGGTLTHQLRGVLGTQPGNPRRRRWICGAACVAFCVWLAGHLTFGLWDL